MKIILYSWSDKVGEKNKKEFVNVSEIKIHELNERLEFIFNGYTRYFDLSDIWSLEINYANGKKQKIVINNFDENGEPNETL